MSVRTEVTVAWSRVGRAQRGRVVSALVTDGLAWWAETTPDQPAIIFDGADSVSYRELAAWTDAAAQFGPSPIAPSWLPPAPASRLGARLRHEWR